MIKQSLSGRNTFCPQTLFLYGTYNEDGKPDFGQFCWVSYYWNDGLGVMAAICEDKLTRDNIRAKGVFSMGMVTEDILPLADYLGNKSGYDANKMNIPAVIEKGRVLDVPVLEKCHWTFELEVIRTFAEEDVNIFMCKIRNVLVDEALGDSAISDEEKLNSLRPINYVADDYYSWDGRFLGKPGFSLHSKSSF